MKIQYLAVLFVLIIVPISIVMASYIQNQIDAIMLQTQYDKCLIIWCSKSISIKYNKQ